MPTYFYTRVALLRMAALVLVAAFAVSFTQNEALIGARGLLPATVYLDRIAAAHPHPYFRSSKAASSSSSTKRTPPPFEVFIHTETEWCAISPTIFRGSTSGGFTTHLWNLFNHGVLPASSFLVGGADGFVAKSLDTVSCAVSRSVLSRSRSATTGGCPSWEAFREAPSVFWFVPPQASDSDTFDKALTAVAALGMHLALFVLVTGCANSVIMFLLWAFYLSIASIGQTFFSFGWESGVCETLFLLIFAAPFFKLERIPSSRGDGGGGQLPYVPRLLCRWLLFRVMIGAGLIKMRADPCWRDLENPRANCMNLHYETQPVPGPLSIFFHALPPGFHRIETLTNHVVELVVPWLLLAPEFIADGALPMVGGIVISAFMSIIILSGNLVFLNWLTTIPAFACFPDSFWIAVFRWMPLPFSFGARCAQWLEDEVKLRSPAAAAAVVVANNQQLPQPPQQPQPAPPTLLSKITRIVRLITHSVLLVVIVSLSQDAVENLLSNRQRMNASHHWLRLVNSHGNFGSITRDRPEIIVQGLSSLLPATATRDEKNWKTYEFYAKVSGGDEESGKRAVLPPWITPFHYRFTWQLWFYGFIGVGKHTPEMLHFLLLLLQRRSDDERRNSFSWVVEHDPFANETSPPAFVRVQRVKHKFNILAAKSTWDWKPFFDVCARFGPSFLRPLIRYLFLDGGSSVSKPNHVWVLSGAVEQIVPPVKIKDLKPLVDELMASPVEGKY